MLPREVPKRTPLRVPITVAPLRVPVTVAPLTAMTPMLPMISKEYPVENSRKRDKVKNKKQQQLKHRYPTRITQISQESNQVKSTERTETRHHHWLMNTLHDSTEDRKSVES